MSKRIATFSGWWDIPSPSIRSSLARMASLSPRVGSTGRCECGISTGRSERYSMDMNRPSVRLHSPRPADIDFGRHGRDGPRLANDGSHARCRFDRAARQPDSRHVDRGFPALDRAARFRSGHICGRRDKGERSFLAPGLSSRYFGAIAARPTSSGACALDRVARQDRAHLGDRGVAGRHNRPRGRRSIALSLAAPPAAAAKARHAGTPHSHDTDLGAENGLRHGRRSIGIVACNSGYGWRPPLGFARSTRAGARPAIPHESKLLVSIRDARAVDFHPNGNCLAVAAGNHVQLIDREGNLIGDLSMGHDSRIEALAFGGKDGSRTGGRRFEWTGEGVANQCKRRTKFAFQPHGPIRCGQGSCLQPRWHNLASGGNDRTVSLWDPIGGQERAVSPVIPIVSCCFSLCPTHRVSSRSAATVV